uniref:PX domain-containing protein n=1 Tax=Heterorhabditis bacteriophora TaxID=37862 RepID=A0A1I7WLW7_HETBA
MAMLNIETVSPQMDSSFNAKILNYKIIEDGKYAVYNIQITVDSCTWTVERRYSDFDSLDLRRFPNRKKSFLPPKKMLGNLAENIEEQNLKLSFFFKFNFQYIAISCLAYVYNLRILNFLKNEGQSLRNTYELS